MCTHNGKIGRDCNDCRAAEGFEPDKRTEPKREESTDTPWDGS